MTVSAFFCSFSAAAVELCGTFKQGEILVGKDETAQEVVLNGKKYPVTDDGVFIIALGRDENANSSINLVYPDSSKKITFKVDSGKWDIQRINGVAQQKVTPDSSNDAEIVREQKDVAAALKKMQIGDSWRDGFILPVEGRISGSFGNQRVFNAVPKSPHTGVDIAAKEGTVVKASGDGKVILSGGDYFYSGNMVIIDHGQGLQTIYAHLKTADVKVGDLVKQGQKVGTVGKTGRATGPHLHWGASLNNVRFRPHALLEMKNGKCRKF